MQGLKRMVVRLRGKWSTAFKKSVQLNEAAEKALKEAELRGLRVNRVKSQGAEAILVEDPKGGKVFLWSSEDVLDHARSKKWI